ncbi:acyl-CoA dehydrogenase [Neobacillus niacini]|uniref:acyl-CoA dehydrogenase family protein n=1 Tax=Neobacillus niacini TaxID=86668 RepID=UPI002785BF01|nr:acyl-CoA dehydrogenase family protein [Neobacillus niacini]MDQ1002196.1 acyl-CoA dehydrogenase [Neobacillus niacini]
MDRAFMTAEHEIYRSSLRRFLEKEALPYFDEWEETREVPKSFWKKFGEQGFLCPWVDERYGGLNADFGYSVILTEELEKVGSGLGGPRLHNNVVMPYIEAFGTPEQKEKWLPRSITGELISSIAMSEPGAGSDLSAIKTTAVRDGDHYVINGEKTFISNGISTNFVILVCKTNTKVTPPHKGISLIVVDAIDEDIPGFKKGKKLKKVGQHSADTAELIFEDARVPVGNLLGEEGQGFYYLMKNLQQERLMMAISAVTSGQKMLELTIKYVKERKVFGKEISKYQNTQFKLAEMATQVEIARTFVDNLIGKHMEGKKIIKEVSMAKWWTTEMVKKMVGDCMQLHGGYGYIEEYEIARMYRDLAVTTIYGGTSEIMKVIIAKELGL